MVVAARAAAASRNVLHGSANSIANTYLQEAVAVDVVAAAAAERTKDSFFFPDPTVSPYQY